jgi:hypothetical protein
MSFDPLSILNLKFRRRTVAVFRNHCARYEVRPHPYQPVPLLSPGLTIARLATIGYHRGRPVQLPSPTGSSRRRYHSRGDSAWLSRDRQGRTVEGDLADGQRSCVLGNDCSRIWCVLGSSNDDATGSAHIGVLAGSQSCELRRSASRQS